MVSSQYDVAAMRVIQGFGALIESESSARTTDIAFLDSALELISEDQIRERSLHHLSPAKPAVRKGAAVFLLTVDLAWKRQGRTTNAMILVTREEKR